MFQSTGSSHRLGKSKKVLVHSSTFARYRKYIIFFCPSWTIHFPWSKEKQSSLSSVSFRFDLFFNSLCVCVCSLPLIFSPTTLNLFPSSSSSSSPLVKMNRMNNPDAGQYISRIEGIYIHMQQQEPGSSRLEVTFFFLFLPHIYILHTNFLSLSLSFLSSFC